MERSSILLHFANQQRQLKTTYRFRDFFQINFVIGISCINWHLEHKNDLRDIVKNLNRAHTAFIRLAT